MFAISFDMSISDLEQHYGKPYNRAYFEIKEVLKKNGFDWILYSYPYINTHHIIIQ